MAELGCATGCGLLGVLLVGILYFLYGVRVREDAEVMQITQYGGQFPLIGVVLLGGVAISLDRDSTGIAIVLGVLALFALGWRPLWISTRIDRMRSTITNRQLRLWGLKRAKCGLEDVADVAMTEQSDVRGRSYASLFIQTGDGQTIDLLIDQGSGSILFGRRGYERTLRAMKQIKAFLAGGPSEP